MEIEMAKYAVTYQETLAKTIIVEADSCEDAEEKILDAVGNEAIVLTADDYLWGSDYIADVNVASQYDIDRCDHLEETIFNANSF